MRDKVLVVIPVYNHGTSLHSVAKLVLEHHPHLLVVDDGSTDGGTQSLDSLSCTVVVHEKNTGKGAAILTAAQHAESLGMTHIITIDADGQHSPEDLAVFFAALEEDENSLYVGARDFSVPNVPGSSKFGRQFSRFWLRVQTGWDVSDPQSGFRAYPVALLNNLKLSEPRYAFEIEVLAKAAWAGIPLKTVPISVYYPKPEERVSHFHKLKDNVTISLLNTRLTMRSMVPLPHGKFSSSLKEGVTVMHPIQSLRLLLEDEATPQGLALAGALGAALGTLPLIGLHSISILLLAGWLRLNKICGLAVSQLCIPPFVPAICIEVGHYVCHGRWLTEISLETLGYQALDRLWEWVIGSLIVAPIAAVLIGGGIWLSSYLIQSGLHTRRQRD